MKDWLAQVGELTAVHREARARALLARRTRRRLDMRADQWSERAIERVGDWYQRRAKGYRERIETVRACGSETLRITCQACGLSHDRATGCRVGLLCVSCRGAIAERKRAAFRAARAEVIAQATARGLLNSSRPKGRFSEKFLTLTAPHLPRDTIEGRIARVLDAWARFLKRLNTHFREHTVRSAEWFRVFEWTPGDDQRGHPHLHIWIFSPFIPVDLAREWWSASLAEAGCPADQALRAVVDLREVHGADGGARELIKYLTKDITASGKKVAPELYAEVYKALDGHRATQASCGFMARAEGGPRQCECGTAFPRRVQRLPRGKGQAE